MCEIDHAVWLLCSRLAPACTYLQERLLASRWLANAVHEAHQHDNVID